MTTTPTLREAAQQALSDLLEAGALDRADERITVLRAALSGQAAEQAEPVVLAELYVDAGKGLVGTRSVPVKSATWNDDGSLAVRIDYWPDPLASARMEPFGYVTIRRLSQRHENHADHYEFYPSGQSPYLDNVDDCIAVYKYHAAQGEQTKE